MSISLNFIWCEITVHQWCTTFLGRGPQIDLLILPGAK